MACVTMNTKEMEQTLLDTVLRYKKLGVDQDLCLSCIEEFWDHVFIMKDPEEPLKVTGHSDDIMSMEGAISDEYADCDMDVVVTLSTGTSFRFYWDPEKGKFRIDNVKPKGKTSIEHVFDNYEDDVNDEITISGSPIEWLVVRDYYEE